MYGIVNLTNRLLSTIQIIRSIENVRIPCADTQFSKCAYY